MVVVLRVLNRALICEFVPAIPLLIRLRCLRHARGGPHQLSVGYAGSDRRGQFQLIPPGEVEEIGRSNRRGQFRLILFGPNSTLPTCVEVGQVKTACLASPQTGAEWLSNA